jgi:sterol desaturase/sphingolipid hydroxylase (fatty acid hydroxylase superfamily)
MPEYSLTKSNYYADFVIMPVLAAAALLWLVGYHTAEPKVFFSALLAGVLGWSFTEYMLHRYVLHKVEPLKHQHILHHIAPDDYIGASSWITVPIFSFLIVAAVYVLGPSIGVGLSVGILSGYYVYIAVHDRFHHTNSFYPLPLLVRLAKNHAWHHQRPKVNFGVSSPLWDLVFGTYATPRGFHGKT